MEHVWDKIIFVHNLIHVEYILMLMQWYLLQIIVCQLSIGDRLGCVDIALQVEYHNLLDQQC